MSCRRSVLGLYKHTMERVVSEIEKKGYITSRRCESLLQEEITEYKGYYTKLGIEPFSDKFAAHTFKEFLKEVGKLPRIMVKNVKFELFLPSFVGNEIFSFSQSSLEKAYNSLKKKYEKIESSISVDSSSCSWDIRVYAFSG